MKVQSVRKPIASGKLYPADPETLRSGIESILNRTDLPAKETTRLIVVPQGPLEDCADLYARSYAVVRGDKFDTVVLLAYSESEFFNFISVFNGDEYHSPLGSLKIDYQMRDEFADEDDDIFVSDKGHFNQDSFIEMQLPFLQVALQPGFKILPIIIGNQSKELCDELAHAMGEILHQRNCLVVVCGDMISEPDVPDYELEERIAKIRATMLDGNTDFFFTRQWKGHFLGGAYGPFHIAAKVSKTLNYKTLNIYRYFSQVEKWEVGNRQVTYFSMAYSRLSKPVHQEQPA